jgi:predicted nucleotidyltransferase component of viral defense system
MIISERNLREIASKTGYAEEPLEKVLILLKLLDDFSRHPFLQDRIVLKGGTALNLFFGQLPRLSVDIDLNYIGSRQKETMEQERGEIFKALGQVCHRIGLTPGAKPQAYAGGTWPLSYRRADAQSGSLALDINFLHRVCIFEPEHRDSEKLGEIQASNVPVQSIYELLGGKLVALFARTASRDLFDVHRLMSSEEYDEDKVRTCFIAYGGAQRDEWRNMSLENIDFQTEEVKTKLLPVLTESASPERSNVDTWAETLIEETQDLVSSFVDFTAEEQAFLDSLCDDGEIRPSLLTSNKSVQSRLESHPVLQWKAQNVREYDG